MGWDWLGGNGIDEMKQSTFHVYCILQIQIQWHSLSFEGL